MAMRGSRGGSNRSEGTTVRGGRRHLGSGPWRHAWKEDVCTACGVRREGYSGGYTGMTRYVFADGSVDYRAGACLGAPRATPTPADRCWWCGHGRCAHAFNLCLMGNESDGTPCACKRFVEWRASKL